MLGKSASLFSERLAGGLRIREIGKGETAEAMPTAARKAGPAAGETANTKAAVRVSLSDTGKFAVEFMRRCQASAKGDEQAATLLTESLIKAASEISSSFGQEKADEFLNDILAYTEKSLTESRLSGAISDFFGKFSQEAIKNNEVASKICELVKSFNSGLDILCDKENLLPKRLLQERRPGLAFAMNNFFSTDYTVSENKGRVIAKGFDYYYGAVKRLDISYSREGEWQDDGPGGPGYYCYVYTGDKLTVGELESNGALSEVAAYLKTTIGNERAASYLETLDAEANLMEAMTSTIAIVALENGVDPAIEYVRHLNGNLKNAINSVTLPQNGAIFDGWFFSDSLKTSQLPNSELTVHAGYDDIFGKGHLALDWSWQTNSGIGEMVPLKDLNELYSSLRSKF